MRILFVEDDIEQLNPLRDILSRSGYVVDGVEDGKTAQWLIETRNYDLLILDWMLPDISGLDLCRHYRRLGKATSVLILTAKDTTFDKVTGLDAGADDYLVKPIDLMEFMARVRALGRRSPLWRGDVLSLADLQLHLNTLTVQHQENTVRLSGREFQLMEYLLRHPNQVLSRAQIEQSLWEWHEEPESNAVTTLVKRLRQRLQKIDAEEWIETVYGMGYCLKPPRLL